MERVYHPAAILAATQLTGPDVPLRWVTYCDYELNEAYPKQKALLGWQMEMQFQ